MHSLSFIARAFAAFLAVSVLAAHPAAAASFRPTKADKLGKGLVSANDVQSVIDYLGGKGDSFEKQESDIGNPLLVEANNLYEVYFDCAEDHSSCDAIEFRACYSDYPGATIETANAIVRDYMFARSYISVEGYACLSMPVVTGKGGISTEALDRSFEAFLWFRENADTLFGGPVATEAADVFDEAAAEVAADAAAEEWAEEAEAAE